MKFVEDQWDVTSEDFTGDVKFDIDPKVKVVHNTITFQQPVFILEQDRHMKCIEHQ